MEYKITIGYIGNILSDNSYKFQTRGTKPFCKMWMRELEEKVEALNIPRASEYIIKIEGHFTDQRRPDLANLHKVIGDAIKKGLLVDDKFFRFQDGQVKLGFIDPELEIIIEVRDGS